MISRMGLITSVFTKATLHPWKHACANGNSST